MIVPGGGRQNSRQEPQNETRWQNSYAAVQQVAYAGANPVRVSIRGDDRVGQGRRLAVVLCGFDPRSPSS